MLEVVEDEEEEEDAVVEEEEEEGDSLASTSINIPSFFFCFRLGRVGMFVVVDVDVPGDVSSSILPPREEEEEDGRLLPRPTECLLLPFDGWDGRIVD